MDESKKSVEEFSQALKSTTGDHFRNALMAAISGVPYAGGALATLFEAYIPKRKQERLLQFVKELGENVEQIGDRLNKDYITTDEFAFAFERTLKGVLENYQQEKLKAFRAALLNTLITSDDVDAETRELYLRLVDDLTHRHIRLLNALIDPAGFDLAQGAVVGEGEGLSTSLMSILERLFPDYTNAEIDYVVADLDNLGLTSMHQVLQAAITDTGIHQLEGRLTKFGEGFVSYIKLPEEIT